MAEAEAELAECEQTSSGFVFGEIHRLGLENNVLELEEQGFTIVPDALPMDMVERMREVIVTPLEAAASSFFHAPGLTRSMKWPPSSESSGLWVRTLRSTSLPSLPLSE